MWWTISNTELAYESVGLVLGLLLLFALGALWCWACDVVDAYPEAFGCSEEQMSQGHRGRKDQTESLPKGS